MALRMRSNGFQSQALLWITLWIRLEKSDLPVDKYLDKFNNPQLIRLDTIFICLIPVNRTL